MSKLTPESVVTELMRTVPVLEQEAEVAMHHAVDLTFQRESELAPKGATGELARDITHTVRKTKVGVSGTVRPRSKHARFVDQGTGHGKVLRSRGGSAYSAATRQQVSAAAELADPFGLATASSWGSKTPGKPLALHMRGGILYRQRVRGQRARHFVQHTRDLVLNEVESLLAGAAEKATRRLFP